MNTILHGEDEKAQDDENLILVFDNSPEEIYPLEDTDTISIISEIQNYVDNLELDLSVNSQADSEKSAVQDIAQVSQVIIETADTNSLPTAPDEIVILDHKNNNELSFDLLKCNLYDDQKDVCNIHNIEEAIENTVQDAINVMYEDIEINLVDKQVEHNDQKSIDNKQIIIIAPIEQTEELCAYEQPERYLVEQIESDKLNLSDNCPCCITIEIDAFENEKTPDNGIFIFQDVSSYNQNIEIHELKYEKNGVINLDNDIVPVPHDLINSVKKATNKKKKLEKKEKSKFRKKSKKIRKKEFRI